MKKIILLVITFSLVFLIYYFNRDKKIYYVSLGDFLSYGINNSNTVNISYSDTIKSSMKNNLKKYVNYSSFDDYRVRDLINDINYNKEIYYKNNNYKLQNLLIKANFITLSIGMNDLIYKSKIETDIYEYTDELLNDIDELFKILRKYNKDKIYFLSFYNVIDNKELIEYANNKLEKLCKKYKIFYVDISLLDKYIIKDIYPTNDGYIYIANQILNFTK